LIPKIRARVYPIIARCRPQCHFDDKPLIPLGFCVNRDAVGGIWHGLAGFGMIWQDLAGFP
jgi:hypothetical protein